MTNFAFAASPSVAASILPSVRDQGKTTSPPSEVRPLTDRYNRRAGFARRCLFRRTVNVAGGLWHSPLSLSPFYRRRRRPVRPGSPTRGHVARMASATFSFLPPTRFFFLPRSLSFSMIARGEARARRAGCRLLFSAVRRCKCNFSRGASSCYQSSY